MLFPRVVNQPALFLGPTSWLSLGHDLASGILTYSTPGIAAWPSANTAYFYPFVLHESWTVRRLWIVHAGVTGNYDLGIYTADGTRIVSTGSTASGGSTALVYNDITDLTLGAGRYYFGVVRDGTSSTGRFNPTAVQLQAMGVKKMDSAFPLPSTATFADMDAAYLPLAGMTARA